MPRDLPRGCPCPLLTWHGVEPRYPRAARVQRLDQRDCACQPHDVELPTGGPGIADDENGRRCRDVRENVRQRPGHGQRGLIVDAAAT